MPKNDLSSRQEQCVYLLAEGLSYSEIASRLQVAHSTVRHHLQQAYRKLGVGSGAQAVLKVVGPKRVADTTAEVEALEREAEQLKGEVGAVKLTIRAFDALLAGDRYAAIGLRVAADELRVQHGLPRRAQSPPDVALERILTRCGVTPRRRGASGASG